MALAVAMYTQQNFIRAHTGYHPFLQATILMVTSITLVFKTIGLLTLTTAIILNDGEIFVACAQEDIDRLLDEAKDEEKEEDGAIKILGKERLEGQNDTAPTYGAVGRPMPIPSTMTGMPIVYSCGVSQATCLYRAASTIALVDRARLCSSGGPSSFSYVRRLHNPTKAARRCFSRRQSCLLRLRHLVACYPILQLVLGAASIAFWFSSKDTVSVGGAAGLDHQCDNLKLSVAESVCRGIADRLLTNSQLPSLRLFNAYLLTWAILVVHTPLLLLFSTWHYARVDWQMQVLAVYNVLHRSDNGRYDRHSSGSGSSGGDGESGRMARTVHNMTHDTQSHTMTPTKGLKPCPTCEKKDTDRLKRKMDRIRDSQQLRRAVDKEERRRARAEAANAQMERDKRSSIEVCNDHREAALEALVRGSTKSVDKASKTADPDDVHIRQPPFNMPVSPTSMSFITFRGTGSALASASAEAFPASRAVSSSTRSQDGSQEEEHVKTYDHDPFGVPAISRPASIAVAPQTSMPSIKPILQDDHRPIATRKRKHVSFPAHVLSSSISDKTLVNSADKRVQTGISHVADTEHSSPSFSQGSHDSTGAALTTISEETFNSNMSPVPRGGKRAFSWLPSSVAMSRSRLSSGGNIVPALPQPAALADEEDGVLSNEDNTAFRICIEADHSVPNSARQSVYRPRSS